MTSYPNRQFILIGDSGEHDPEIYGWAAGTFPNQVKEIYIRNVTHETYGNQRLKDSFGSCVKKVRLIDMNTGSIEQASDNENLSHDFENDTSCACHAKSA